MTSRTCDVAIVGAGISGLAAAHFLLKSRPELGILVLESGDRVGGRALTKPVRCSDGASRGWCFGASRIGKGHKRTLALLQELGLTTFEVVRPAGKSILEIGDTVDKYEGDTPNLGALTLLDLDRSLKSLDKQAKTLMQNRGSWAALDAMTLGRKIEKETWKQSTRQCLTAITEPCFDGSADKVSCLQALRIANSAGGLLALMSEGDGLRIVEGAQAICTRIADRLGPDRVLLGQAVSEVSVVASDDRSHPVRLVTRDDQLTVSCRFALVTLPLVALSSLRFSPELPPILRTLAASAAALAADTTSAMSVVSAVVTYPEPAFWRRSGFTGDLLSHLGKPVPGSALPYAPVAIATEAPSADNCQPAALAILSGYPAEHVRPTPETLKEDFLAHLSRFFPAEDVSTCVDFVTHDWGSGQPSGASALPPGAACDFCDHAALTEPAAGGRLLFAGTDLASEWIGTVEGAVQSAVSAAEQLLNRLSADL